MTLYVNNTPGKMPWWRHALALVVVFGGLPGLFWALGTAIDYHMIVGNGFESLYLWAWGTAMALIPALFFWLTAPYMRPLCRRPDVVAEIR